MKQTIYTIIALLTLCITGVKAQEIEVPEDAPRETWQLVYDDYRAIYWGDSPEYKNLTMDVTVVRGENCLYVQGIAKCCPDSWIKINCTDEFLCNDLLMWSNQPVTVDGSIYYLITGLIDWQWDPHNTAADLCIFSEASNCPLVFKRDLSSDQLEYCPEYRPDAHSGFWVKNKPNGGFRYYYTNVYNDPTPPTDSDFPDDEIYMNPRLICKTSSIGSVNITDNESDAPVYTLTGIRVDRNHLTPGIYVSRDKKFVVK